MRLKDLKELTEMTVPFFRAKGFVGEEVSDKEMVALERIVEILREHAHTLKEIADESTIYFKDEYELPELTEDMDKKERKGIERLYNAIADETGKKSIKLFLEKIENYPTEDIPLEEAKKLLTDTLEEIGEGPAKVYMPLRAVLTGEPRGADLYNLIFIIGKTRTINRMKKMIEKYNI